MGLFDFLRLHKDEQKVTYRGITFWAPKPISNDDYQAKRQRKMDALEHQYDLSTVEGINAIPVPRHKQPHSEASVTGKIEYYLMLKATEYQKAGAVNLALACLRKANQLMPMSSTEYQYDTYMRLPRYLRQLRRFDEARAEEAKIEPMFPPGGVFELSQDEFIRDMQGVGHSKGKAQALSREYKAERDAERKKAAARLDYEWLWEFLPEVCPKSFSGYMRMRGGNTEKFKQIAEEAKKCGRQLV